MYFAGVFLAEIVILYILARNLHLGFGRFFYKLTKSHKWTSYLLALLFLPGTLLHELSHFLTALFLLVPVGELELIPEIEHQAGDKVGVKLGSVGIGKTDPFRRFLIGVSPMFVGVAVILLAVNFSQDPQIVGTWWKLLLIGYIVFEVGITMFSSRRDLEGAWKVLLVFGVIVIIAYFGQFRPVLSDDFIQLLKKLDIFMAVPIIINIALVLVFKLSRLI